MKGDGTTAYDGFRLGGDAKAQGVAAIALEATQMGRALYLKCGFVRAESEMALPAK